MTKKDVLKWGGIAAALIIVWLLTRARKASNVPMVIQENAAPGNLQFYAPYYGGVPGASETPGFQTGDITVNVDAGAYGHLNNSYIPLFGFVGVTAVGG